MNRENLKMNKSGKEYEKRTILVRKIKTEKGQS